MKKLNLLIVLCVTLLLSCSSDDNGGEKTVMIENLSQISGNWKLESVTNHDGDLLLPDCDVEGSNLFISSAEKTLQINKRVVGNYNNEIYCTSTNPLSYNYKNLKLTSISNLEGELYSQAGVLIAKYRFGVKKIGSKLEFYLYQIKYEALEVPETITSEKQIVFYFERE